MKILCVCDKGVNRSVHIASVLKFRGHDTLPVGVETSSPETLAVLRGWAELVIVTDPAHLGLFTGPPGPLPKIRVWPIPDLFARPFNRELYALVKQRISEEGL